MSDYTYMQPAGSVMGPPAPTSWLSPSSTQVAQFGTMSSIAGAVGSALGSYYSAQAQRDALKMQAETAATNARLAEKTAQSVLLQGQEEAGKAGLRTAHLRGTQRASLAANGLDLGEGSAARILTDTEVMGQRDVDTIRANALRAALGYREQGANFQGAAIMTRAAADSTSPGAAAGASLLSGASSVASSWYRQQKAGF